MIIIMNLYVGGEWVDRVGRCDLRLEIRGGATSWSGLGDPPLVSSFDCPSASAILVNSATQRKSVIHRYLQTTTISVKTWYDVNLPFFLTKSGSSLNSFAI